MAHQSFRKDVLLMALKVSKEKSGEVTTDSLSTLLMIMNRKEHKRMLNTLGELTGEGKLRRIRQGVYGPPLPTATPAEPDKREVMWRLLKMRRRVTVDDLMEMAGVSRDYARQWLVILVRREVARKIQEPGKAGLWVLINDSAEMPVDEDKAARLRNIRLKKKRMITKLDSISTALGEVRQILQTMEEE